MLRTVGLSAAEEATYLVLVRHGAAPVAQLADRVGLTVPQVRRAVATLEREGFLHRTPPPQERIVPVPPDLAVEQFVQRRYAELDRTREAAHRLAAEVSNRSADRRTEELIEIVSGRAAVGRAFHRVQRTAREEMRVLVAPPYAVPKEVNPTQLDREAAGVTYRAVYDATALADVEFAASVATHIRSGEQARIVDTLPTKLAVADRELALLPLAWTSSAHDTALLVHPCGLLDALVALFETVWAQGTPLSVTGVAGLTSAEAISAEDQHLLSLLVAGLTDEAAGSRLGISRRTVVRRVQGLMERTGSRSRLQLGWQARERGWL
ncbi:helix-turn-helix domain-containing protein [Micromonospora polyrhachis]|uniref:Sugar-specific transcriptional regulator TrmB/DNA-binding CsgD family transcriptional regulator n=1 Tax=Micromonospora polyrhachis TaxID=1282883 RepID=A0A7W7SN61_9ACTN|nr:helix-turn-helix domain-containing protein [Micromonospora polyrhachis]MBB4957877.1 sugar-specific transcriptional regulator TrmB/DNA-binding CsgD family transcriptional regulator [Micromonospora polyrhachis]